MEQKELARLLDISPAMVSRLAKRGMPTDTLERAQRWRKRHLDPGRVKGSRADTFQPKQPASQPTITPESAPAARPSTVEEIETLGDLIDGALNRGNLGAAEVRVMQLRRIFKLSSHGPAEYKARLTIRTWVALLDYTIHFDAVLRHAPDQGEYLNASECGQRIPPDGGQWEAETVLWVCCDFDDDLVTE